MTFDSMTFVLKLDLDVTICTTTQNEVSMSTHSKVVA